MANRINPYKLFTGAFIPNCILSRDDLMASSKLVYARLCQYTHKEYGYAYPKLKTLASEVGLQKRQVINCLRELVEKHLIEIVKTPGKPNKYYFLDKPVQYNASRQCSDALQCTTVVHSSAPPYPYYEKINEKNICEAEASPVDKSVDNFKDVFIHWQSVMNHPQSTLDNNRKRLIINALKKYTLEEVKLAIDGCASSDYHMGANPQNKRYDSLGLILRNSDKIESFMQIAKTHAKIASAMPAAEALHRAQSTYGSTKEATKAYHAACLEMGGSSNFNRMKANLAFQLFQKHYHRELLKNDTS